MACQCAICDEIELLTEKYTEEVYIVDCGACDCHTEEHFCTFDDSDPDEDSFTFSTLPASDYPRPLKFNTSGKGLTSLYKEYVAAALRYLWEIEKTPVEGARGAGSGEIWRWLNKMGYKAAGRGQREGSDLSRASVIFGLNALVDQKILSYTLETGKGGHHRIYRPAMTPYEFKNWILDIIQFKLAEVFNDGFWEVRARIREVSR